MRMKYQIMKRYIERCLFYHYHKKELKQSHSKLMGKSTCKTVGTNTHGPSFEPVFGRCTVRLLSQLESEYLNMYFSVLRSDWVDSFLEQ